METDQWLSSYFTWLHDQYKLVNLKAGDEITTSFTNSIGDNIRIYAMMDSDNHLVMTDDGNMLNDLEMIGIDVTESHSTSFDSKDTPPIWGNSD